MAFENRVSYREKKNRSKDGKDQMIESTLLLFLRLKRLLDHSLSSLVIILPM